MLLRTDDFMMFDCRNDIIAKFTFSSQCCSALSAREKFATKCMVTMYHSCGSLQKKLDLMLRMWYCKGVPQTFKASRGSENVQGSKHV